MAKRISVLLMLSAHEKIRRVVRAEGFCSQSRVSISSPLLCRQDEKATFTHLTLRSFPDEPMKSWDSPIHFEDEFLPVLCSVAYLKWRNSWSGWQGNISAVAQ